jgi:hypothetical protein
MIVTTEGVTVLAAERNARDNDFAGSIGVGGSVAKTGTAIANETSQAIATVFFQVRVFVSIFNFLVILMRRGRKTVLYCLGLPRDGLVAGSCDKHIRVFFPSANKTVLFIKHMQNYSQELLEANAIPPVTTICDRRSAAPNRAIQSFFRWPRVDKKSAR